MPHPASLERTPRETPYLNDAVRPYPINPPEALLTEKASVSISLKMIGILPLLDKIM